MKKMFLIIVWRPSQYNCLTNSQLLKDDKFTAIES